MRWGVSVRRTSLRAKPTDALCPTRAGDRYDDALQLTAVLPNEPMALLGESADGRFCRVETSYFAGWVPAEDIGLCRNLEAWRTAQEGGFLRVTGSRVTLCCDPYEPRVSGAALPMGTRLPLAAPPGTVRALRGRMGYDNYLVRLPVRRTDGWLEYREAMVPVSADVCVGDLPYTHENVAAQAAKMRGEVYGWGGMLGGRDCSALVGDVYRCFGFRLPRDAAGLALLSGAEDVSALSADEKCAALCTLPVGTILYFPGHVMLSWGVEDGEPRCLSAAGNFLPPGSAGGEPRAVNPGCPAQLHRLSVPAHKAVHSSASWAFFCSAADCKSPSRPFRSCSSASGVAPSMPETLSSMASANCSAVIAGCCTSCPLVNSVNIFSATFLLMASCSA